MKRRSFVYYAAATAGAAAVSLVSSGKRIGDTLIASIYPVTQDEGQRSESSQTKESEMELGAFSVSLTVKDLEASKKFYENFGFKSFAGDQKQNWLILKNGDHVIGLFQGMFDKNMLTFNPGWDQSASKLSKFTDVRELQRKVKEQGVKLTTEADESTTGPASFMAVDPDGNPVSSISTSE